MQFFKNFMRKKRFNIKKFLVGRYLSSMCVQPAKP